MTKFRNINENHYWIVMKFSVCSFVLLVLKAVWNRWFFTPYLFQKVVIMCAEGEIGCTGDSEAEYKGDQEWMRRRYCNQYWGLPGRGWGLTELRGGTCSAESLNQEQTRSWGSSLFVESESSRKPFHAAKKLGQKALLWVSPPSLQLRSPADRGQCPFQT